MSDHPYFVCPATIAFDDGTALPVEMPSLREAVQYVAERTPAERRASASIHTVNGCYRALQIREMYLAMEADRKAAATRH
jgi:hypothetical protein